MGMREVVVRGLRSGAAAAYSTCRLLLFIALLFSALLASYHSVSNNWRDAFTTTTTPLTLHDHHQFLFTTLLTGEDRNRLQKTGFSCHSDLHSKVCLSEKAVRMNNSALQIYISSNNNELGELQNLSPIFIHPYAMQEDKITLRDYVTPVKIIQFQPNKSGGQLLPACDFVHDVPVLIFSTGGFTGNLFHEFDETIIPLFITSFHFQTRLQFLITDYKPWWVRKYNRILSRLSRYDAIDPAKDPSVHCFTGAVIGLKFHDILSLNYTDIPGGYSMSDFRSFLRLTYNLQVKNVTELRSGGKPVLMLISRKKSRRFENQAQMVDMMKELGFQVITTTPQRMSNLDRFSSIVNSCSVMVGAHGAGLTNELFLAAGAVVVQVVPLGLDWPSTFLFGQPATHMDLHYLEYKIQAEESSLWDTYGQNHPVITDPQSIFAKGYFASRAIYIDAQNLRINLTRFRDTMIKAKKLLVRQHNVL